jgi:hypothetical protein
MPRTIIRSDDATVRGLAAAIMGLADSTELSSYAIEMLTDEGTTALKSVPINMTSPWHRVDLEAGVTLQVKDLAQIALTYRWTGGGLLSGFPFEDSKKAKEYFDTIKDEHAIPSEWVFRFRRASLWQVDRGEIRSRLLKLDEPTKGIAAAAVSAFLPGELADEDVVGALKASDAGILRRYLEGKWRMAGMTLAGGPNSKHQWKTRREILRLAPKVFTKADAQWIHDAGFGLDGDFDLHYIVAAATLDPSKGVQQLMDGIGLARDQGVRCAMLAALWSVGGEPQISYIKDRYFAEKKPEYNAGGLQEDLIERLAKDDGEKAAPLLRALVLDKRFTTLGWAATRAFAKNAELLLGEETKEVKRYLGVEHRMGVYDFEHRPEERDKYLVDTKHVLMQTEAFQRYLQGEVLKRSGDDDDAK